MFFFNKIGHTGTLDPIAEGLLVLLVNRAVKLSANLLQLDKEYVSLIKLGVRTDSFDSDGKIIQTRKVPELDESRLLEIIKEFEGNYRQTVPAFSAKKFQGRHLYYYARNNIDIGEIKNDVRINKINIIKFQSPYLYLRLSVSSGAYIRAIAEDIGKRIGCGAVMAELKRIRVGSFHIDDALKTEEIVKIFNEYSEERLAFTELNSLKAFIPLKRMAEDYKKIYVKERFLQALDANGPLYEEMIDAGFGDKTEFRQGDIINIKSIKTQKGYLHRAITNFDSKKIGMDNKKLSKFIAMI